jgi:hypothetical protein
MSNQIPDGLVCDQRERWLVVTAISEWIGIQMGKPLNQRRLSDIADLQDMLLREFPAVVRVSNKEN